VNIYEEVISANLGCSSKIQVRLLKAEVGKVSKATVFVLGLVDSKGKPYSVLISFLNFFFFLKNKLKEIPKRETG